MGKPRARIKKAGTAFVVSSSRKGGSSLNGASSSEKKSLLPTPELQTEASKSYFAAQKLSHEKYEGASLAAYTQETRLPSYAGDSVFQKEEITATNLRGFRNSRPEILTKRPPFDKRKHLTQSLVIINTLDFQEFDFSDEYLDSHPPVDLKGRNYGDLRMSKLRDGQYLIEFEKALDLMRIAKERVIVFDNVKWQADIIYGLTYTDYLDTGLEDRGPGIAVSHNIYDSLHHAEETYRHLDPVEFANIATALK